MTKIEKINAITRSLILFGVFHYYTSKQTNVIKLITISLIVMYFIFENDQSPAGFSTFTLPITVNDPETCTKPTKNNPFMNMLPYEYSENIDRGKACEGYDEEADKLYNESLFTDVNDVFQKRNGRVAFNTMPNTTAGIDRIGFGMWLYGNAPSCKDNPYACNPREDLRAASARLF